MVVAAIILLSLAAANAVDIEPRRCILHNKTCVTHCPRSMHAYHTNCDADTMSQRTCSSPLTYTLGYTCGWSRCDCNGNTMLDEATSLCVKFGDCPARFGKRRRKSRKQRRPFGLSKKIRIRDYEDPMALIH